MIVDFRYKMKLTREGFVGQLFPYGWEYFGTMPLIQANQC